VTRRAHRYPRCTRLAPGSSGALYESNHRCPYATATRALDLRALIEHSDVVSLVAIEARIVVGFGIAAIHAPPNGHDPAGAFAMTGDFVVASPDRRPTIGRSLLDAMIAELRHRDVIAVGSVCGRSNVRKRRMLRDADLPMAAETYVPVAPMTRPRVTHEPAHGGFVA
jgi:hypothetical protein